MAISFLIREIALAGFRPLGQVRVQLKMVWQRKTDSEFSILTRRWSPALSRESAIQR